MKSIELKLFGAFKRTIPEGVAVVKLEKPCGLQEFKELLRQQLGIEDPQLIEESVLATANEILSKDALIFDQQELAILPPVCGG